MKKYLLLFVAAIACLTLSISLSACGGASDSIDDNYEDVFTYSYTGTQGNVPDHKYEAWKQDFERYAVSTNKITAKQARDLFNQTVLAINKDAGAMEDIQQFRKEGYEGFSITLWLKDSKGRVLCKNTWN